MSSSSSKGMYQTSTLSPIASGSSNGAASGNTPPMGYSENHHSHLTAHSVCARVLQCYNTTVRLNVQSLSPLSNCKFSGGKRHAARRQLCWQTLRQLPYHPATGSRRLRQHLQGRTYAPAAHRRDQVSPSRTVQLQTKAASIFAGSKAA